LHSGLFKNTDDNDMVLFAKIIQVKTPKRQQLNNIKWDPINKTYNITFTYLVVERWGLYEIPFKYKTGNYFI